MMGNLNYAFCRRKPVRVLLLGLDAAGKTTILYQCMGKDVKNAPTIGFNVENCQIKDLEVMFWDVSSRALERPLWRYYYPNTQGIVYVVDSNDWDRMTEARVLLHNILSDDELKGVPVAIALNKRDLKNCMTKEEMEEMLDVSEIQKKRPCRVFMTTIFPTDEIQTELMNLFEWISEEPKQKESPFSSYFWTPV
eukprot:XP_011420731.1 PREDICTED: ADP-ribosylation factor-like [Crassostrea gigas]